MHSNVNTATELYAYKWLTRKLYVTYYISVHWASQVATLVKNPPANAGDTGSIPGSGRSPLKEGMATHSIFLPGESHGQRSLAGYSPRGCTKSDMTEAT